jgi:hypothetical protein
MVPAYNMPLLDVKAIRIVVRQDFSDAMRMEFIHDLKSILQKLNDTS